MVRGLLASVLVTATLAAPALVTMCQVLCAEAVASHAGHRGLQHSCHEAAPQATLAIAAVPHVCAHAGQIPAGIEHGSQTFDAPSAVVMTIDTWMAALPVAVLPARAAVAAHSPPGSFQLVSRLRV